MYFWFYCIFILYILDIHSVMTLDMKTLLFYQIKFIYDVLSFVNFLFLFYSIFFFRLRRKWRRIRTSRCFNFQNFLWSWFAEKYLFYVLSALLRYVKRLWIEKGLKLEVSLYSDGHTLRLVLSLLAATTWNHFASKIKSKKADKTTCWYLTRLYILHFPTSCAFLFVN